LSKQNKQRVSFVAVKPTETKVQFRTRDGEKVKFEALKPAPQRVTFWAQKPSR
jgi:hypothetical protein